MIQWTLWQLTFSVQYDSTTTLRSEGCTRTRSDCDLFHLQRNNNRTSPYVKPKDELEENVVELSQSNVEGFPPSDLRGEPETVNLISTPVSKKSPQIYFILPIIDLQKTERSDGIRIKRQIFIHPKTTLYIKKKNQTRTTIQV